MGLCDSLAPTRVGTTWLAPQHSHAFLIHITELFTMHSSTRSIRFLRIITPQSGKTAHTVKACCHIGVEWKHWCLCNFSHGITLPTASYEFTKFNNTLMKDLIDDYYAMITRRPCHGSWILRVNESWRFRSGSSLVFKPSMVSGVSGRKRRYQLFRATVWHPTSY